MAANKKTTKSKKKLDVKVRMIGELIDVTGSSKDSWNSAEISDDMKAISYIRKLADTWNPAQLNEALKYLGFATIDSWNPAIIEETKNKLVKYFLPTDASGNPIELDLKGSLPYEVTALTIDLLPIQDLHGYDSPWVGGAGKNKLNATGTIDNCTLSYGIYTLNSAPSSNTNFIVGTIHLGVGDYKINGGYDNSFRININVDGTYYTSKGDDVAFSITTEGDFTVSCIILTSATAGKQIKPMIRLSSVTDGTFAPYENICPITGRDSVTLTVNGDDTEITFEDTVYGGNVNVLEGGTSSTYGYIASYDGEELPGAWISDRDAYAVGTTPTTGAEVAYVMTTPEELTTPANEIALVNGANTLSTDGDTINITYKANLNS